MKSTRFHSFLESTNQEKYKFENSPCLVFGCGAGAGRGTVLPEKFFWKSPNKFFFDIFDHKSISEK